MPDKVKKYDYHSSYTGGVKPMSIRGLFEDERMRLSEEFTDVERRWRKQWLQDQKLSPNEPRLPSEEWIKLTRNPFRRILSKPWNALESGMTPIFGKVFSFQFRYFLPRAILFTMGTYFAWYHFKYNQNDWTSAYGPKITMPKPVAYPGDKVFPLPRERFVPHDYDDRGFKARNVFVQ